MGPVHPPPQCQEPSGKVGCKCMSFCKLSLSPSGWQRDRVTALANYYECFTYSVIGTTFSDPELL